MNKTATAVREVTKVTRVIKEASKALKALQTVVLREWILKNKEK